MKSVRVSASEGGVSSAVAVSKAGAAAMAKPREVKKRESAR